MTTLVQYAAVGTAGCLGAAARLLIGQIGAVLFKTPFPLATFIINVVGSFILGAFLTWATPQKVPETLRLAVAVGFVGAFTTFSTFTYDSSKLYDGGMGTLALLNVVGSVTVGIIAVRAGVWVAGGGH